MPNTLVQNQPSIRVVSAADFSGLTAQTPGAQRFAAISSQTGVQAAIWGGLFVVEPGAKTGIHHHGEQDTIAYVLDGTSMLRWGDGGEFRALARAGDFLYVPAYLPHQEFNPSEDLPFRWVVVRSTPEPIVINLADDYWSDGGEPPLR